MQDTLVSDEMTLKYIVVYHKCLSVHSAAHYHISIITRKVTMK